MQGAEALIERIVVFLAGMVGGHDQDLRRLAGFAAHLPDRHRQAGLQFDLGRMGLVAEGRQQGLVQREMSRKAFVGRTAATEPVTLAEPAPGTRLQPLERGAGSFVIRLIALGLLPGVDPVTDVSLEDFGQVVMAEEFVFVGDPGKGLDGFGDGHKSSG
jgi:hypothetical protein